MANTGSPFFLPYPENYDEPADSPAALEDLASATHTAIETRSSTAHEHVGKYARVFLSSGAPLNPQIGDIWVPT